MQQKVFASDLIVSTISDHVDSGIVASTYYWRKGKVARRTWIQRFTQQMKVEEHKF